MSWSKLEQKTIEEHGKSLKIIEQALVGNLETKEPGMIDELRDTRHDVTTIKVELKDNKKQHFYLFGVLGFLLLSGIYYALGGDPTTMVKWIGAAIVGRL